MDNEENRMLSILNRGTIISSGLEEMVNQIAKFRRITGNALLGELEEGKKTKKYHQ